MASQQQKDRLTPEEIEEFLRRVKQNDAELDRLLDEVPDAQKGVNKSRGEKDA